jgi:hypothetical protein
LAKEDAIWRELIDTDDFLKSEAVYLKYSREMISCVIYQIASVSHIFREESQSNFRRVIW